MGNDGSYYGDAAGAVLPVMVADVASRAYCLEGHQGPKWHTSMYVVVRNNVGSSAIVNADASSHGYLNGNMKS